MLYKVPLYVNNPTFIFGSARMQYLSVRAKIRISGLSYSLPTQVTGTV